MSASSVSPLAPRSDRTLPAVRPADDSIPRGSAAAVRADRIVRSAVSGGAPSDTPPHTRRDKLVQALLAQVPRADRVAAQKAIPAILDAARRSGSCDPNRIGYLLATAQLESDFGANMIESGHSANWFNRNYGATDGNRPGTNDGYAYRGRGYVQTTHAGRYAELSHALDLADVPARDRAPVLDRHGRPNLQPALVADPDRLVEPELAARALVVGIEKNLFTHNPRAAIDTTIPPGRAPGEADFYHARALVNGIVHDQAVAVARHATTYAQILDGYRISVLEAPVSR